MKALTHIRYLLDVPPLTLGWMIMTFAMVQWLTIICSLAISELIFTITDNEIVTHVLFIGALLPLAIASWFFKQAALQFSLTNTLVGSILITSVYPIYGEPSLWAFGIAMLVISYFASNTYRINHLRNSMEA